MAGSATAYKQLNRIGPDVLVYSRLKAFEGAITVTPNDLPESFASQEFPTFALTSGADANFFRILTTMQNMWDALQEVSKGMGGRRERVKPADLLNIVMDIPPLPIQRWIVKIVRAVDEQIAALDNEAEAAMRVRDGLLGEFTAVAPSGTKPLGALCAAIGSGPSWAAKDESSVPSEGAWTVVKITNTKPNGSFDLSELAYVKGLPARTRVIGPTTLVMIRTNGNRTRIGNVYLPPEEVYGAAVSAFQFILDATDVQTRDYLYLVLRSPRVQNKMSGAASGSTGLGNLAARWLKTLNIPWPDAEVRKVQVETVKAVDAKIAAIRAEVDCLRSVRGALLSGILNRTIDIEPAELGV
ncbi:restriction endonuclease subunit S [Micromonospora sp. MMS20-R1-14]|uniref:Restriction endonuclease subunit S n=2 Tax=Micromonospora humida TaxID=2809018 RepID=A0ABS2IML8_9ACTN|nr:restriction endonuclease subunit S [Micromonospora humida]